MTDTSDLTAPVDVLHAECLAAVAVVRDLFAIAHADVERRANEWAERL